MYNKMINDLIDITDTIIFYNKLENHFILERNNSNKKIKTTEFIKNNKIIKSNINNNIKDEYKKVIINFINVLNKKLKHCNLENLNNKLSTIKIDNIKMKFFLSKKTCAAYDIINNKLVLNKKKL